MICKHFVIVIVFTHSLRRPNKFVYLRNMHHATKFSVLVRKTCFHLTSHSVTVGHNIRLQCVCILSTAPTLREMKV